MKVTRTFRIFNKLSILHDKEKYGQISIWGIILHFFKTIRNLLLYKYSYSSFILEPFNFRVFRAKCWRVIGCTIGQNVHIGHSVTLDYGNAKLITLEDNVIITDNCILLCHRRDLSTYKIGDNSMMLPYIYEPITLRKGVQIGKGSIIMPGVTIGEGSIVGARAVVTKDIPSWSIAVGSPARVIKKIGE